VLRVAWVLALARVRHEDVAADCEAAAAQDGQAHLLGGAWKRSAFQHEQAASAQMAGHQLSGRGHVTEVGVLVGAKRRGDAHDEHVAVAEV
jgi:hypothetical protein